MLAGAIAAVLFLGGLALSYVYSHDPASSPSPKCFFKLLTGWDCPGCGSQRAAYALMHGRIADAWQLNPFIFFAVPAALFYFVAEAGRRRWPRFHVLATHPLVLTALLFLIIAWWVSRNLM